MNLEKVSSGIPPLIKNKNNQTEDIKTTTIPNKQHLSNHPQVQKVVSMDELESIVESFNDFIDPLRTNLKFVFHEKLNEYHVVVVNPLTNEVIKEIPSKKMLDMYAAMAEFMGILIDEKI